MVENQTECTRLEKRFVIKSSVTETWKQNEFYRRMGDV